MVSFLLHFLVLSCMNNKTPLVLDIYFKLVKKEREIEGIKGETFFEHEFTRTRRKLMLN